MRFSLQNNTSYSNINVLYNSTQASNPSLFSNRTTQYSYGFNGKENDPEVVGTGSGTQDYGMRIYNPALGKFLSLDPIGDKFPFYSPYQFAANNPIQFIDLDGAEPQIPMFEKFKYGDNVALNSLKAVPNAATSIVNGGIGIVNLALYNSYMYSTLGPLGYSKATVNYWKNSEIPATKQSVNNTITYFSETSMKQMGTDIVNKIASPEFFEGTLAVAGGFLLGGPKGSVGAEMSLPIADLRYNLANSFYQKFGEGNIASKLKGINFSEAVQTTTLKAGTTVEQWVGADGAIGKYFAPVGSDASKLGINVEGRTLKSFTLTQDVKVLKSTAADMGEYKGGGTQYFNPELKNSVKPTE